ncbi:MAG: hypothetical protein NT059_06430 [Planctomycetota bacterium]|nr:hypothetical protein [Planctomycetota bacterium]
MSMNIKAVLIASTTALLAHGAHGAVVTAWNFNDTTTAASIGNGETLAVETTLSTTVVKAKKSKGARSISAASTNLALDVSNFDATLTRSGHDGLLFASDTTGFKDVGVSYLQLNGAQSSAWAQFQYSIDGGLNFMTAGLANDGRYKVAASKNFQLITFDLSTVAEASNNADFQFRVMAIHAPEADTFAATSGKRYMATGSKADWKFDEVTVTGTALPVSAVPAPGAIALLMAAGSIASGARRRNH